MLEVRPSTSTGSPPITQITFPACRAHYPGGLGRCLSVSSLSTRPSPVNRRVGIHNFTFGACSSFTRVTACRIACPPKRRTLSRGFDPASYPTVPLGGYHAYRQLHGWIPPPQVISAVSAHVESRKGARPGTSVSRWFPFPAHQTGRARFEHPAFRQTSPTSSRKWPQMHIAEP